MMKPRSQKTVLTKRRDLKNGYYSLVFDSIVNVGKYLPGQFLHIRTPASDVLFRRAFSVAAISESESSLEIIMKVVGRGTRCLAVLRKGDSVDILGPLGNPFRLPKKSERALLVAGGVGFPPLLYLASEMIRRGHDPKMIEFFFGGQKSCDLIERARIKKLGVIFHPVTEDASVGEKGFVTVPVEKLLSDSNAGKMRLYGCGPQGMLKAMNDLGLRYNTPGQISLEAPMPCGIGVCLGCVVPLVSGGYARVCHDGPVFEIGEVIL